MILINPYSFGNKLDNARVKAIASLTSAGYFARMDKLFVPKGAQNQAKGLEDWKGGSSASLSGSASWSQSLGFVGSTSASSYVNSNYNPATQAVNFSLNSFSIGAYVSQIGSGDSDNLFGCRYGTGSSRIELLEGTSDAYEARSCSLGHTWTANNAVGTGLLVLQRTASNAMNIYKNGSAIAIGGTAAASISVPSRPIYICGMNMDDTLSNGSTSCVGMWYVGDEFSVAEQNSIKSIIDTYYADVA